MRQIEDKWADKLFAEMNYDEDEYEIVRYGLHQSIIIIINLVSVFICGLLWSEAMFGLFLFAYLFFIRPYAGGYHADTELRCYMISVGIVNIAMIARKFLHIPIIILVCIYIGAIFVIGKNAPVTNPKNILENAEIKKYAQKTKRIIIIYSILFGIGIYLKSTVIYEHIFYGAVIVAISVIAGKYKYRKVSSGL